jgi:hypothetical protein
VRANRILIWRFAAAPAFLQLLCEGSTNPPEWLVLVPQSMSALDLDAVILGRAEPSCIARYQMESGDVVYAGTSEPRL